MKRALVDLGSNTVRLSVYNTDADAFHLLFSEKETAGLAGYISDGKMSQDGMQKACDILLNFSDILKNLEINDFSVFATASLRNITNTDEAVEYIKQHTGIEVDVIAGKTEAEYGCKGALKAVTQNVNAMFDIGGGSTEIVLLNNDVITSAKSFQVGCLTLFKENVSHLLPKKQELKNIKNKIDQVLAEQQSAQADILCGVGGTARALLKISNDLFDKQSSEIDRAEFLKIKHILLKDEKKAKDLILKNCPDRIHTIIPGMLIISKLIKRFDSSKLVISKYGVREGYLCQKLMNPTIYPTHKTEN